MELWELTLTQARDLLEAREITSEMLTTALLQRAAENFDLNAFASLDEEAVIAAARECDAKRDEGSPLPMLHGLPIAIKDNIACAGARMKANTPALAEFVPDCDAEIVSRLKQAGAILFGKNSMHEIAFGGTSNNTFGGSVRNAFDKSRVAAGSSGGTGASVGARIVPAGIGSDTGGSVRVPASFNGVCGYRPTTGRWPSHGVLPLSNTRDTLGPLARSVSDLDLIDCAVVGRDPTPAADLQALRLGKPTGYYWENLAEDVKAVCESAIKTLEDAGATIIEIDLLSLTKRVHDIAFPIVFYETIPNLSKFLADWKTGVTVEQLFDRLASPDVAAIAGRIRDPAQAVTPEAYQHAIGEAIPSIASDFAYLLEENALDAIIYPTSPITAPRIGEDDTTELNGDQVPTFLTVIRNMDIGSVIALPSVSLPVGLDRSGLPIGIAVEGHSKEDEKLLGIAKALEAALPSAPKPRILADCNT